MNGTIDRAELAGLISGFEYGKHGLVGKLVEIQYNPRQRRVKIDGFHDWKPGMTTGECQELMNEAYLRIRQTFPQLYVMRCEGSEPKFYFGKSAEHCFLLVAKENLTSEQRVIEDQQVIDNVIDKNPLLIDPSFGVVEQLSNTGYHVTRIFGQDTVVNYARSTVLNLNDNPMIGVPLGITAKGELVYLAFHFDKPTFATRLWLKSAKMHPCIGFRESGQSSKDYWLNDPRVIDRLKGNDKLENFVRFLTTVPVHETHKKLEETVDYTVP